MDLGSVGSDRSRRYGRSYSGTQLGHSTLASTTTERESISIITLADIACVVAVQRQILRTRQPNQQSTVFFSDYEGRKQLYGNL